MSSICILERCTENKPTGFANGLSPPFAKPGLLLREQVSLMTNGLSPPSTITPLARAREVIAPRAPITGMPYKIVMRFHFSTGIQGEFDSKKSIHREWHGAESSCSCRSRSHCVPHPRSFMVPEPSDSFSGAVWSMERKGCCPRRFPSLRFP